MEKAKQQNMRTTFHHSNKVPKHHLNNNALLKPFIGQIKTLTHTRQLKIMRQDILQVCASSEHREM